MSKKRASAPAAAPQLPVQRSSNLELFRSIAMLLIVAHHYVVNSGLLNVMYTDAASVRSILLFLFGMWGKVGINCFLLITGYFMCRKQITARKYAKLIGELLFYRVVIYAIFCLTGYTTFSLKQFALLFHIYRFLTDSFFNCFLMFYLFIPFLNIMIRSMSRRQHFGLLLLLGFMYVVIGTSRVSSVTMNYVSWFSVLYFMAAYIRLYPRKLFDSARVWGIVTAVSVLLSMGSVILRACAAGAAERRDVYYAVIDANKLLAVTTALGAFLLFKNLKLRYSRFINAVGGSTFGVLCIHANGDTMRQWLWRDLLHNQEMYSAGGMAEALHAVLSVLAVFCICTAIDRLRLHFVEKPCMKVWDAHWPGLEKKLRRTGSALLQKWGID